MKKKLLLICMYENWYKINSTKLILIKCVHELFTGNYKFVITLLTKTKITNQIEKTTIVRVWACVLATFSVVIQGGTRRIKHTIIIQLRTFLKVG